jgi:thiamine-phosphate pyrophosphorylase
LALYALLDWDTLKKFNISIKDFCKTAKGLKAKILQYRDKNSSLEEKKQRLFEIKKYWKKTLIINDDIELIPFVNGIHIGQEDLKELSNKLNLSFFETIKYLKSINPKKIQLSVFRHTTKKRYFKQTTFQ